MKYKHLTSSNMTKKRINILHYIYSAMSKCTSHLFVVFFSQSEQRVKKRWKKQGEKKLHAQEVFTVEDWFTSVHKMANPIRKTISGTLVPILNEIEFIIDIGPEMNVWRYFIEWNDVLMLNRTKISLIFHFNVNYLAQIFVWNKNWMSSQIWCKNA